MGISRSASIVIGYLMSRYNVAFRTAYEHVKKIRPQIQPNRYFRQQLIQFENELIYSAYMSTYSGMTMIDQKTIHKQPQSDNTLVLSKNTSKSVISENRKKNYRSMPILKLADGGEDKKSVRFQIKDERTHRKFKFFK